MQDFSFQLFLILTSLLALALFSYYFNRKRINTVISAFHVIPYPVLVTDLKGNIIRVNSEFTSITGYQQSEVLGKKPSILSSGKQDKKFYQQMWQEIQSKGEWSGELWNRRKDGDVFLERLTIKAATDNKNRPHYYIGTFVDLSEKQEYEEVIQQLAYYDPLTELPNRTLLSDRIHHALETSKLNQKSLAVVFIDLDDFKSLNDSYGHDIGDQYLVEVSNRLNSIVKSSDTICRWGGDEFVILLEGLHTAPEDMAVNAEMVAQRIIKVLKQPFVVNGIEYTGGASIGIALYKQGVSESELLKNADNAMYQSKRNGKNQVTVFDQHLQQLIENHLQIECELKVAIQEGQLELFLQPQSNNQGKIFCAEALVRWNHPSKGMIMPNDFIPIAEKSDLIVDLGDWVINQSCLIIKDWQLKYRLDDLKIAVNISSKQIKLKDFSEKLINCVTAHNVDPHKIKLEITETSVMQDIEDSAKKMRCLENHGFEFSMDDFGTGYSSLSYIQNLPLSQIKVDRTFVKDIESTNSSAVLTKIIIDMASSLNLSLIAEGVETYQQQQVLNEMGCENYQGYLIGKPMCQQQLEEFVVQQNRCKTALPNEADDSKG